MANYSTQRRLAAILAADVAGYTQLMEKDSDGTVTAWRKARLDVIDPKITEFDGRIVKHTGDGFLAEFGAVTNAVNCAVEMQRSLRESSLDFRMGVHLGEVIEELDDIHGEGVNLAARLEALAEPGSICVSGDVYNQVRNRLDYEFKDLGEKEVKNVSTPVQVYAIRFDSAATSKIQERSVIGKPSIAVLAFDNLSGDPEQEYFSDGIAEDLITELSRFRWFFVIARNSSFSYKGQSPDIRKVAADLGVRYVVEGSVRRAGERVRISAQLIDGESGNHVWAERYDRDLHDIFAVQDEITGAITGAIAPSFVSAEIRRTDRKASENFNAWDYAMRGNWHLWRMGNEEFVEAQRFFEAALQLDPKSVIAVSGMAVCMGWQVTFGLTKDVEQASIKGHQYAQRAVELDDEDAWAHTSLGFVNYLTGEHDKARRACQRAISLNPNLALAEGVLSVIYAWAGIYEEAISHAEKAERLSPRDPAHSLWHLARGQAEYQAGNYETAASWAKKMIEGTPKFPGAWRILAASFANLGRLEEAKSAIKQLLMILPNDNMKLARRIVPGAPTECREHFFDGLRKAGLPEN